MGDQTTVFASTGNASFPPNSFEVYGTVTWTNTESTAHAVVLTINGQETYLLSGATKVQNVLLGTWTAPQLAAKTVTISVYLKSPTETSSTATATPSVDGAAAAAFSGTMSISGNDVLLPAWTGAINVDGFNQIGRFSFNLGNASSPVDVKPSDESVAMPGLVQSQVYRAALTVFSSALTTRTFSYRMLDRLVPFTTYWTAGTVTQFDQLVFDQLVFAPVSQDLFFTAPAPVAPFTATSITTRLVRNTPAKLRLNATYRATWAISSGNPGGFAIEYTPVNFGTALGPDEAYLVGTPNTAGTFTINLTATRVGSANTATATVSVTVVDSLPRTTVATNSAIAKEGLTLSTGDSVNIAFQSTPAPASWIATGLPPGVSIDQQGNVTGKPTTAGVYFASITAQATDFDVSLPTTIRFAVGVGGTPIDSSTAAQRSPWLLSQWELTDLHIIARSRQVESTLFDGGKLRIKLGDAINFAVFFVDSANAVFAMAPTQLRLTIRKADNLDDLIIFKSSTPPASATQESQTYYLMPVTTGNREREVVIEWAEDNKENKPLEAVADLDWIKDGKTYSSRSFPVLLELDVTRP